MSAVSIARTKDRALDGVHVKVASIGAEMMVSAGKDLTVTDRVFFPRNPRSGALLLPAQ